MYRRGGGNTSAGYRAVTTRSTAAYRAIADTIEPGEPPALLIHGRDDGTIPFALAEQTCAAATAVGITCELIAHDSRHGMADDVPEALTLADEFLRREMGIETSANP